MPEENYDKRQKEKGEREKGRKGFMIDIDINEYDYDLPSGRIAHHPAVERDMSQILVNKENTITRDIFRNIDNYLPSDSLLVFNNTRVIMARFLFRKDTGASVEILCLEPLTPVEYELSFSSREPVEWKCIVGNLKKWKSGSIKTSFLFNGVNYNLTAERVRQEGEAWRIRFKWGFSGISFGDVIDAAGHIPLPPYLSREEVPEDLNRYQTVYSSIKGSVAAPTAGLHFTKSMLKRLKDKGIKTAEVTLHVGAGTFQPIKTKTIAEHEMHCEHFFVTRETIKILQEHNGKVIPIGTTSVRTLESLYWLGIKTNKDPLTFRDELSLGQWEAYYMESNVSVKE